MNSNKPKTILILAANPTNTSRLRLDEEVREIDEGLRRSNKREQFQLVQKWAVRSRDFYRAILDYQPQIVHFCGHGTGEDGIVLEDETTGYPQSYRPPNADVSWSVGISFDDCYKCSNLHSYKLSFQDMIGA